ncbi:unnamed protein product [Cyclocybe aegerita]|uniref:SnoaL-like domain-containing protein n=1 Tax=Cyclocybe aegerita TaxID=1973307 RepID=A0A8S0WH75_CYCAE|nr:unnamed protein product [Cyclocybe aegerita]
MTAEKTRSVIQQWVDALNTADHTTLFALAAPDATHWISGLEEKIPYAGSLPYAERLKQMAPIFGQMKSMKVKVLGLTVEGDTGVLEVESRGEGPNEGQVYENNVMMKFVVKEEKIQSIREYVDFLALFKYLGKEL